MAGISDIIGNVKGWFQEKMKPQPRPEDEGKTFGQGEFHYDDPQLIEFIQRRADQNGTSYQEELMKFVDEVEGSYRDKKDEGGIVGYSNGGYILFKGSLNPKNPMMATEDKLKELSSIGYKQGKDYDIVSLKVLEDVLGKKEGGIASIRDFTAGGHAMGPGTGTSDSIPAFLSDGEFVMTAKAVKGFGGGNREKGAQKLYSMMEKAENSARNTRRS